MSLKDKKILWITDHTTEDVPAGGAEITDSYIISAAKELGYTIEVCLSRRLRSYMLSENDIIILSNCYDVYRSVRDKIMQEKQYIIYSHDSGRWMSVMKENPELMKYSLINIFLSPLHRDCFTKYFNSYNDTLLVSPHIPFTFIDKGEKRLNRIMYAGNIHDGKGLNNIIEFAKNNKDINIDFYSNRGASYLKSELKRLKNCHLKGYIKKEEMADYYNKYKYFVHLPKDIEAFGRAVGEAILCGCKVISNSKIGALSYNWDYKNFRINTLYAHYYFWNELENRLKHSI